MGSYSRCCGSETSNDAEVSLPWKHACQVSPPHVWAQTWEGRPRSLTDVCLALVELGGGTDVSTNENLVHINTQL